MELKEIATNAINAGNFPLAFTLYETSIQLERLELQVKWQRDLIKELEERVALQDALINQIDATLE